MSTEAQRRAWADDARLFEVDPDDGRTYWAPMIEVTGPTWRRVLGAGEVHAVMPDRA